MDKRRQLCFESLDQVSNDVAELLAGYSQVGEWNLSQVCGHLDQWMTFPMDGFPKPPFPMNVILWTMKHTIAKSQLQQILADGFKPGIPTMPQTVPESDIASDEAAAESLQQTIRRFSRFDGDICPSPLFGAMDRETAMRLQLTHCAHHLSFLLPEPRRDSNE